MTSLLPARWRRGAAVVLLLAVTTAASGRDYADYRGREWLQHYYQHPAPERFIPSVFELSRTHYFNLPGNVPIGLGFFASLFRRHPDYIDEWLFYCRMLPEQEQRLIISALWMAGHPKGEEYLRLYAEKIVGPDMAARLERTLSQQRSIDDRTIDSPHALYLQWGVYLATGDEAVLRAIFEGLIHIPNLSARDRWWLACAAARHERVLSLCREELTHEASPVHDVMQLVVDAHAVLPQRS